MQRHCTAEGPGRRLLPRGSPGAQPRQLGSPSLLWRSRVCMRSCPHSPLCGPALVRESRYLKGCGGLMLSLGDTTDTRTYKGDCVACDHDRYKSLDDVFFGMSIRFGRLIRSPLQVAQPPSESPLHAFLTCAPPSSAPQCKACDNVKCLAGYYRGGSCPKNARHVDRTLDCGAWHLASIAHPPPAFSRSAQRVHVHQV